MVMLCYESLRSPAPTDEELVRRARGGNSRAVESLLTKYRPLVESKTRTYFLLGADHDDVVQEGMIGLYKAIRDFREDRLSRFRGFADLCVTRQIITAVKNATRQKHQLLNTCLVVTNRPDGESETELIDCLPDPRASDPAVTLLQYGETYGRLDAIRPTLSPLEAGVLDCYLQGKSYREMSIELRCPSKAIDNALQRVKRKVGALSVLD